MGHSVTWQLPVQPLCINLGQGVCRDMGGDLSQPVQSWRSRARSFVAVDVNEVFGRRETLSQDYYSSCSGVGYVIPVSMVVGFVWFCTL